MKRSTNEITCPKCNGRRHIERYGHIAEGRCFTCAGNGTVLVRESDAARCAPSCQLARYALISGECCYRDSDDLAALAAACVERRANPDVFVDDPQTDIYIVHTATGERVTRREVAAATRG